MEPTVADGSSYAAPVVWSYRYVLYLYRALCFALCGRRLFSCQLLLQRKMRHAAVLGLLLSVSLAAIGMCSPAAHDGVETVHIVWMNHLE